ncbi:arylamine N-acetyltransferase [Providencia burhodogranariea DSM 19968]|uniref:Arylamine N-acetyltransferase n=1 Tax=Providencia burhodogranariea DSM 19968 TaxID=1141662 RepID=K8WB81_9GAMM|nr:arylamine N-acetyltransferase [Providencia burhodogranariea DSM 19968]
MKDIWSYINRLALSYPPKVNLIYLSQLHYSHFYTIPFENFNMKENAQHSSIYSVTKKAILEHKRGGIYFEFAGLIVPFFEKVGFIYHFRLARLFLPTMTPATHQIYIISIEGQDWLFDVDFGARGPRGLLLLKDGFEHKHPFLSSRISKSEIYGWVVSIKENSKPDADWENIYAFHDI